MGSGGQTHRRNLRGVHVPPLFWHMAEKISATFPQRILKIHCNGRSVSVTTLQENNTEH